MAENIMNEATISYVFSGSTEARTDTSNVTNVTLRDANGISITKTSGSTTFVPGGTITYVVTITNTGTSWFSGVRITDNLSGNGYLTYVPDSAVLFINSQYLAPEIASTSPLVFTLSPLSVGQTMVLTYTCRVPNTIPATVESITNTVEGIGYTFNSTATDTSSHTVTRSSVSEVNITKTASAESVAPGELFSYTLTLTNQGTTLANVTSVVDDLPEQFTISSIRLRIGTGATTTLSTSDYVLDSNNRLTIPSSTGPSITVPGSGSTVITITGTLSN